MSTLRNLKKSKDARPFLVPVDVVAMNIPYYPEIITHLMDFSTIEHMLSLSNPTKPNPNPENPRYLTADQFIADVRPVFTDCIKFDGPDHAISQMGKRVDELKFCGKLLSDFHCKTRWNINSPFYDPIGASVPGIGASRLFLTIIPHRSNFPKHPILP